MTIQPGDIEFPNNVLALLGIRIPQRVDDSITVLMRPLRTSDASMSVGLFPAMGNPDITTIEMSGRQTAPTIKRYSCVMQSVVIDTDEEAAISVHSILTNRLWRLWYHDIPLDAGLTALAVEVDNSRERMQRRGIQLQRYLSNEIQGSFIQTSWIEFWFETETVGII